MNYKYAALFVLFNPSEEEIKQVINFSKLYDAVYVYDNSEKVADYKKELIENEILYYGFESNDGLSKAYNFIIKKALEKNYDWLSIYDQDSIITEQMVSQLKTYVENASINTIASVVPAIQYSEKSIVSDNSIEVAWAINSGQMINLKLLIENNIWFDENIFLDRVDRDFCKQVELANLKIIQVGGAILWQHLGEKYKGFNVHSPLRNYYMMKNRLYYNHKYCGQNKAFLLNCLQSTKHIVNILRSHYKIIENMQMIRRAYCDYKMNKMGKIL